MTTTKPSISINSLLSVIPTDRWAPLDMALMPKLTGYRKAMASVKFREMLGIPPGGGGSRTSLGLLEIDAIEGVVLARCFESVANSGHRFHWRVFPKGTDKTEILASAKSQLGDRAFLSPRARGLAMPAPTQRRMTQAELNEAANLLFAESKAKTAATQAAKPSIPVAPPVAVVASPVVQPLAQPDPQPMKLNVDVKAMSDDELIACIKSRRQVLIALEHERDCRVRSATNLIAKLKA
jgi:hypothetical protein